MSAPMLKHGVSLIAFTLNFVNRLILIRADSISCRNRISWGVLLSVLSERSL